MLHVSLTFMVQETFRTKLPEVGNLTSEFWRSRAPVDSASFGADWWPHAGVIEELEARKSDFALDQDGDLVSLATPHAPFVVSLLTVAPRFLTGIDSIGLEDVAAATGSKTIKAATDRTVAVVPNPRYRTQFPVPRIVPEFLAISFSLPGS